MKSINWHTGTPTKSGYYLTTRLSKIPGSKPYVHINLWTGLDWPGNKTPHWQVLALDNSEVIAWASEKEIEPYKIEDKPEESDSEVLDAVLRVVQDNYDCDATPDSVLGSDICFDSLDQIEFTMFLEKEFNISILNSDIYSFYAPTKVREVATYITKRLKEV